jgi:glucarate dehydratase
MSTFSTPVVTSMQVIPVAGHDSMLMNLSGAHAPFFTDYCCGIQCLLTPA